jgi:hypothetical protein
MPQRGQHMSEEAKAKLAATKRGLWADPDSKYNSSELRSLWSGQRRGNPHPHRGGIATPEAVAKRATSNRGKKRTPEQIARVAERWTPEARKAWSESLRGQWNGRVAAEYRVSSKGYRVLSGQYDHPLAKNGRIYEHCKVLYDAIGPDPHPCHWGCGRMVKWGGRNGLHVDHVDGDNSNNARKNLVPSCPSCNKRRAMEGNPSDWHA